MAPSILKVSFQLPPFQAEWAGQALITWFPDGLAENSSGRQQGWLRRTGAPDLKIFRSELKALGASSLRLQKTTARDWVGEYQAKFPLQKIGRFVIVPSWRRKPKLPPSSQPIYLLPGQAFGTGLHDSTRLMLRAIQGSAVDLGGLVLDIGAGSGILSFAALRLGAPKAVCVEIEGAAVKELRSNAKLNGFGPSRLKALCGEFPGCLGRKKMNASLLLANLVTPLLCLHMKALAAQTAPQGRLFFSGIHTEAEADRVALAARKAGLGIDGRESKGAWWCLRATKP